jgi:hypothetical protein
MARYTYRGYLELTDKESKLLEDYWLNKFNKNKQWILHKNKK